MKIRKISRISLSLIVAIAMSMALIVPSFASTAPYPTAVSPAKSNPQMPIYSTGEYGVALSVIGYGLVTEWDTSGCQLHGMFDGDCMLRRLRLTFDDAYQLKSIFDACHAVNDANYALFTAYHPSYGRLSDYMSEATFRQYLGNTAYETLKNLRASAWRSPYWQVRQIVDEELATFDGYYAVSLRRSLAMFMPEAILKDMNVTRLMDLAKAILNSPAYIEFFNTLYGHDCSTVKNLMGRGYSLGYVAQLYTNSAESAVKTLWPDYQRRINTYRQTHGGW